MAESTLAPIDINEISNMPLSSSYDSSQSYFMVPNDYNSNALVYSKSHSTFWWAIMILTLGLSLAYHYLGLPVGDENYGLASELASNDVFSSSTIYSLSDGDRQDNSTSGSTNLTASFISFTITVILFKIIYSYSSQEELIFDPKIGFTHHKISNSNEISVIESVPFKNIVGIQKLKYDQSGEQFYGFEINLVLNDYSRINLFASQQENDIALKASMISNLLGKKTIDSFYSDSED